MWLGPLALLAGCHVGWSTWQGAEPRAGNAVKLALYTPDANSKTFAHQVLARDPHVTVIDLDPAVIERERVLCGDASCPLARDVACAWARGQGLDYYVIGRAGARFDSTFVCTAHRGGSIFDKNGPPCSDGYDKDQHTTATFTLDVHAVDTCQIAPGLSTRVSTRAEGAEDLSKPEAIARLNQAALAKTVPFPDQITVGPGGSVDAPDGYYARYRAKRYRGFVAVESGRVRALHCCDASTRGDVLVARGPRRLIELALDGVVGSLTFDGRRRLAGGVGAHLRYYPLDAGVRVGVGADLVGSGSVDAVLFTPEVGWGFRPSSALSLSANLGLGLTQARQRIASADAAPKAYAPHAMATVRVVTFFAQGWYVGGDVGYVYTGALDRWEGDGAPDARPMSIRTPIARLWLGLDM